MSFFNSGEILGVFLYLELILEQDEQKDVNLLLNEKH